MTASASTSGACPSTSPGQAHAMRDSTDNDARSAVGPRQAEVKMARDSVPCTCGHDHAAHRHYRSGVNAHCADAPTGVRIGDCAVSAPCCVSAMPVMTEHQQHRPAVRGGAVPPGAPTVRSGARTAAVISAGLRGRSSAGPANMSALSPDPGSDRPCRCGHAYVAHQHYRSGSECSLCPECPRFRPALGLVARMIAVLTGRPGAP